MLPWSEDPVADIRVPFPVPQLQTLIHLRADRYRGLIIQHERRDGDKTETVCLRKDG